MIADQNAADAVVLDLRWMGHARCIAAWRIGEALVDCGPRTCLDTLLDAVEDWRPRALLVTHVHFDHAGAAGALVRRWPDLQVHVHRRGARHLPAPERLEASARRVFGPAFDERFGSLDPIPDQNLHPLDGGEQLDDFEVIATPGHASHHVSYLHASGSAFVGDVAGVRLVEAGPVLLATPPPDIDVDQWTASVEEVASRRSTMLALPHFGSVTEPEAHFAAVRDQLQITREAMEHGVTSAGYVDSVRQTVLHDLSEDLTRRYELVVSLDQNYVGLKRWLDQSLSSRRRTSDERSPAEGWAGSPCAGTAPARSQPRFRNLRLRYVGCLVR